MSDLIAAAFIEGNYMLASRAVRLELSLARAGCDPLDRVRLLGFASRASHSEVAKLVLLRELNLWFAEHDPMGEVHRLHAFVELDKDPTGHARVKQVWLRKLEREPKNLAILRNAAAFLSRSDFEEARALLERGETLDLENAHWLAGQGKLLAREARRREALAAAELRRTALDAFSRAVDLNQSPESATRILMTASALAIEAGEFEQARVWALQMVAASRERPEGEVDGDTIYSAHSVLGQVALAAGDLEEASRQLLEAGRTPGSPVLNSFGPDLTLAQALLDLGRRDVVLEFLKLCARFWVTITLDRWIRRLEAGEHPKLDRFSFGLD